MTLGNNNTPEMNYYTFEIDGSKVGYFEYEDKDGILYQKACMSINGEHHESPFWVKHRGTTVHAYKSGCGEYIDLPSESEAVPSSALMLFLASLPDSGISVINEGSGEIAGEANFVCVGEKIQVVVNGEPDNYFILDGTRIVEFGWGGTAVSRYVPTREAAVAGTKWG